MSLYDVGNVGTLKDILEETELFLGEDGLLYSRFMRRGQRVMYATSSPDFMAWFKGEASERINSIPGTKLVDQAIKDIEYKISRENVACPVASRIYAEEDAVFIARGNGEVLEINAAGAATNDDPGIIFPTVAAMEVLPAPESANILKVLPEFLGLSEDENLLALIWLMSLLQPNGRYPILIIIGPRQSGKTRLAGNFRRLLDPRPVPLLPLPKDLGELKDAVLKNVILAFDNVKKVPAAMQKELLALAEGTALSLPGRPQPVRCKRPIILVSDDLPDAPDLLENAIVLRLKERPAKLVKSRSILEGVFRQQHAKVFGSLINLCSLALQHREAVELDRVHKDAELERWILTVDKALALEGKMLPALQYNLQQTVTGIVKERPAVRGFLALVRAKGSVKATATELLDEVEAFLDVPKDASYPTSGRGFADLLRSHKRFMTDIEIEFGHRTGKNRDRNISASWQGSKTAPAAVAARSASKAAVGRKKATGLPEDQPTLL